MTELSKEPWPTCSRLMQREKGRMCEDSEIEGERGRERLRSELCGKETLGRSGRKDTAML